MAQHQASAVGNHWRFSERLFYLLWGEQIGKAEMKVEAVRRQLGGVKGAWTSVMCQRAVAYIGLRSVFLTDHATYPSTVSWPLK